MNRRYPHVAHRAIHRCEYCRAPEAAFNLRSEVDHITPQGRGQDDQYENLALGCRSCNLYKSDAVNEIDPTTSEAVRLFHPRLDRWADHFTVEIDQAISGITDIGRATVMRLRMNGERQIAARR